MDPCGQFCKFVGDGVDLPLAGVGGAVKADQQYCGDIEVIMANTARVTAELRMKDLLPLPFDGRLLS